MPKSKRSKIGMDVSIELALRIVSLSKTKKQGREGKEHLFASIQSTIYLHDYCWVFSVENMRNNLLKLVRTEWKDSRIFFGRTKVMAKALGTENNLDNLSKLLVGDVGLLFTCRLPQTVVDWFGSFVQTDFARAGVVSPKTVVISKGPLYSRGGQIPIEEDVFVVPQMEPTFRKLGMSTALEKGVVVLLDDFVVCTEGKPLDSNQTQLLKLFGVALSEFKVQLMGYWNKSNGVVTLKSS